MSQKDIFQEFTQEVLENIDALEGLFLDLEQNKNKSSEFLVKIYMHLHTIKGICGFFEFYKLEILCHRSEDYVNRLQKIGIEIDYRHIDYLIKIHDQLKNIVREILAHKTDKNCEIEGFITELQDEINNIAVADRIEKIENPKKVSLNATQKKALAALDKLKPPTEIKESKSIVDSSSNYNSSLDEFLKVEVNSVSRIVNMVDEMLLLKNQLLKIQNKYEIPELGLVSKTLSEVLDKTHLEISQVSMEPISAISNKLKRVVRNLGQQLFKKVELTIKGEDTRVDRRVINSLYDPLIHILRNAVDHGIESPEARIELGKDPVGKIEIEASYENNFVNLRISDDGMGVDLEKVKARAIVVGLYTAEEFDAMSIKEKMAIIFEPGFSTKDEVTMVSGRGIGMAAIRDKLNGKLSVESEPGQGTTIKLSFPLTLAVISGVRILHQEREFIIPSVDIVETSFLEMEDIRQVDEVRYFKLRNETIPVVTLENFFSENDDFRLNKLKVNEKYYVLIVKSGEAKYGIVIDSISDLFKFRLKSFKFEAEQKKYFLGSTISADGKLYLVLNVHSISNEVLSVYKRRIEEKTDVEVKEVERSLSLILAQYENDNIAYKLNEFSLVKTVDAAELFTTPLGYLVELENRVVKIPDSYGELPKTGILNLLYQPDFSIALYLGQSPSLVETQENLVEGNIFNYEDTSYKIDFIDNYQSLLLDESNQEALDYYKTIERAKQKTKLSKDQFQALTFNIDGINFAIHSRSVREIYSVEVGVKIPRVPELIKGLINHRGSILVSKSLKNILGIDSLGSAAESQVVLFVNGKSFAVSVDEDFQVKYLSRNNGIKNHRNHIDEKLVPYVKMVLRDEQDIYLLLDEEALADIAEKVSV